MLYIGMTNGQEMSMHVGYGKTFGFPVPVEIELVQADGDELEAIRQVLPAMCPPTNVARVVKWQGDLARFVYEYGVIHAL